MDTVFQFVSNCTRCRRIVVKLVLEEGTPDRHAAGRESPRPWAVYGREALGVGALPCRALTVPPVAALTEQGPAEIGNTAMSSRNRLFSGVAAILLAGLVAAVVIHF